MCGPFLLASNWWIFPLVGMLICLGFLIFMARFASNAWRVNDPPVQSGSEENRETVHDERADVADSRLEQCREELSGTRRSRQLQCYWPAAGFHRDLKSKELAVAALRCKGLENEWERLVRGVERQAMSIRNFILGD
jgi:hypothetical protein